MEAMATSLTRFFLKRKYIEPDQVQWLQYGIMRRLMGGLTFVLLVPVGATIVGWFEAFLFVVTFRFLRTRTGGYHAKTQWGCLLASLSTMVVSLVLAKYFFFQRLSLSVLLGSVILIWKLSPANNAALHLTKSEIMAIRPRIFVRLIVVVLMGFAFQCFGIEVINYVSASTLAVAVMLMLSNLGYGMQ